MKNPGYVCKIVRARAVLHNLVQLKNIALAPDAVGCSGPDLHPQALESNAAAAHQPQPHQSPCNMFKHNLIANALGLLTFQMSTYKLHIWVIHRFSNIRVHLHLRHHHNV